MNLKVIIKQSESYAAVAGLSNVRPGTCTMMTRERQFPFSYFGDANREIGVPGSKTYFQSGADAGWRRDCRSGK